MDVVVSALPLVVFAIVLIAMARRMETRPEPHRRRVPTQVLLLGPLLALSVFGALLASGRSVVDAAFLAAPALISGAIALVWAILRRGS